MNWQERALRAEAERDKIQAAWQKNVEDLTRQYQRLFQDEAVACAKERVRAEVAEARLAELEGQ